MKNIQLQLFFVLFTSFSGTSDSQRFLVVSDSLHAEHFYPRIRDTKPARRIEPDVQTKKRICEDITSNYLFLRRGEYPHEKCINTLIRVVDRFDFFGFDYRTEKMSVSDGLTVNDETVFVCTTRKGWLGVTAYYYISDQYNLNAHSNTSKNYMAGRFVFRKMKDEVEPRLVALAELPAEVISHPDHNIENYYLQRREKHAFAMVAREKDALCKLQRMDWHRICVAVFNSRHYAEKLTFSNADENRGHCESKTFSFRTGHGRAKTRTFKEWMLSCRDSEDSNNEETSVRYWLSHAYQSDQIFVYSSSNDDTGGNVFLENLAFNVRITFDPI